MISTSGSGQMLPLPMNEIIQQQVKPIGFDLNFEVVDWGTMLVVKRTATSARWRTGSTRRTTGVGFGDPASMFRYFSRPPCPQTASTRDISTTRESKDC